MSPREVVSFVHRGGRMTDGQQRAWAQDWDTYGRELAEAEVPLDLAAWFDRTAPVVMEIGTGTGEPTAVMAERSPEVDHLAVEVYQPGLAQLLMRVRERELTNLRLLRGDAVVVLREHLLPDTLSGLRIYFPDPWPKRKHHKRRLVQPGFVTLAASRLRPGGILHLATDWTHYAEHMRRVCDAEPALARTEQVVNPRPETKFERRAHDQHRAVCDLTYRRV